MKISPSKLKLAQRCSYPWGPDAPEWPSRPSSSDANYGTAVHAAAECTAIWGDAPVEDIAAKHRLTPGELRDLEECSYVITPLLERELETHLWRHAEVTLAFDRVTGRARKLPAQFSRDYSDCTETEIPASLDLVFRRVDGQLVVRDWKTGMHQRRDLDARTDPQLLTYALTALAVYGGDSVMVEIAHVSVDEVRIDAHLFDAFDLDAHRAALDGLLDAIVLPSEPEVGHHCRGLYCPIVAVCPETKAALAQLDTTPSEHPMSADITSTEHAVSIYHRLAMVKKAIEHIEDALKVFATKTPIEVDEGLWYGAVEHSGKERIDIEVAGAVSTVRKHLEGEAADIALEVSTSKAALERGGRHMLRARGNEERGALKKVMTPLLDDLRRGGALKQGPAYTQVETFKKKEPK